MKKTCSPVLMLCVVLAGGAGLARARSVPPTCKAFVSTSTRFYLVSRDGSPVAHFPPVEASEGPEADGQLLRVALSPSGRRIAFIPKGPGYTFVIMDDKGHQLTFPSNLPANNAERDSYDALESSSKRPLEGIAWTSDGVIRLEKDIMSINNERFEFYRFLGHSHRLTQVAKPSFGITCAASPVGGHVACLDAGLHGGIDNDVEVDGSFMDGPLSQVGTVFSNDRNTATRLTGSITLGAGESASIPGTRGLRVHVLSVKHQISFRVIFHTGNWSEISLPVGMPDYEFFGDEGQTVLELLPIKVDSATGKVTMKAFLTPTSSTGFAGDIAWMPDHEGIVTVRNSPKGPELILLSYDAHKGMHVVASTRFDDDDELFLDPVSASELYFETSQNSGLVPLETDPRTGKFRFGKPVVLPSKATLKLGRQTLSLPVLTWSCH